MLRLQVSPTKDERLVELIQLAQRSNHAALFELCERNHWKIATELLASNPKLVTALKSSILYDRMNVLVDEAVKQGDPSLAWPVLQQLLPAEEQLWLSVLQGVSLDSKKLSDGNLSALELHFKGQSLQALALQSVPLRTRLRIALSSAQWGELLKPEVSDALLGSQHQSPGRRASQIVIQHINGKPYHEELKSLYHDLQWNGSNRQSAPLANENQAKRKEDQAPIASPLSKLSGNPPEFSRLISALILAGQGEDVGGMLLDLRDEGAFSYLLSRSNHDKAFQSVGLAADLNNFDTWTSGLPERLALGLRANDTQDFETMSQLCGTLFSLGFEAQGEKLLEMLVEVGRDGSRVQASSIQAICWNRIAGTLERAQVRWRLLTLLEREYSSLNRDARMQVLGHLYPEWSEIAPALLATAPVKEFAQAGLSKWDLMEQLWRIDRDAFGPQAASVLEDWLNQADDNASNEEEFSESHLNQFMKLATQLRLPQLAYEHALGKNRRAINWSALAEISMRTGDLQNAAEYWDRARTRDTTRLDWLAQEISARALAGQSEQAGILEDSLAYRPLSAVRASGESAHRSIAIHLVDQEQFSLARRHARAAFLLSPAPSTEFYFAGLNLADVIDKQKEPLASAEVRRAVCLTFLSPSLPNPTRFSVLLSYAQREQVLRAAGLLARSDIAGAQQCIETAEQLQPLGIELVEECYPKLVELQQHDVAKAMFERFERRMLQHLDAWPKDATNHNNLAWMYARCNQQLDNALKHAKIATELAPQSATLLDTLAEVHFRLGQQSQAIEVAQNCVRLDPREPHYQQQLDRFRRGTENTAKH